MREFLKLILFSLTLSNLLSACNQTENIEPMKELEKNLVEAAFTPLTPEIGKISIPTGTTEIHIYRPDGVGPFPVIYFLQGYPCRTINPAHEKSKARARLIERFVKSGYLVYMAEKPGMGELAEGTHTNKACEDMTYQEEVAAFSASFDKLQNNQHVNPDEIFIFGHSMGGQTAPLIAQDHKVAGIITYGIHAKPWFEFMIDITRAQGERLGMDPVKLQMESELMIPFLYDLMVKQENWQTLSTRHTEALKIGVMPSDGQRINGRDYRFWATLNDADFVSAWAAYEGQVLAIYGEYDIASISQEGAQRIAQIVNYHHPGNARALVLPQADHNFARFEGSFEDYKTSRFSKKWTGEYIANLFDDRIAEQSLAWIQEVRLKLQKSSEREKLPSEGIQD